MTPLLLLLWACASAPSPRADDTADPTAPPSPFPNLTGPGIPPGGRAEAEVLVQAAPEVASGGHLWTLSYMEYGPITLTLDGVELEGHVSPSYPSAAVWAVPDDHPIGTRTLEVSGNGGRVYERRDIEVLAPRFTNVASQVGLFDIHDTTGTDPDCAQAFTGLAWADFDLDDDFDVLIGHYGPTSRLLLNDGAPVGEFPQFTDASTSSGFDGVDKVANLSVADIDADGDPDVFVGRRGNNLFLRNEFVPTGTVRFTDVSAEWGLTGEAQRTMGAVFGDPDADGDLDFYEINHTWCFPGAELDSDSNRASDHLWRNDDGVFVDVSYKIPDDDGIRSERFGFVGLWVDHERDGDQDLFVVNDFVFGTGPNVLLRNDAPTALGLVDAGEASGFAVHPDPLFKGVNGMGISVGDLNHDRRPDFAVSNIGSNLLVMSTTNPDGTPGYTDEGTLRGADRPILPWGAQAITWGTQLFDHDNDGDLDVFYVGGPILEGEPQPHALFDNDDGSFHDIGFAAGLSDPGHGKASALVDLDKDGFLDLTVANWAGCVEVYQNHMGDAVPEHHWLQVELVGDGVQTHPDAFGAIVELTTPDGTVHTCFRTPNPSLSGGSDPACHFGLGSHTEVSLLEVIWPDGRREQVPRPSPDQRITVHDTGDGQ